MVLVQEQFHIEAFVAAFPVRGEAGLDGEAGMSCIREGSIALDREIHGSKMGQVLDRFE